MKYRKKPVIIEAVQFKGNNEQEIIDFTKGTAMMRPADLKSLRIPTLEGDHIANVGDWIIKGIKGEFYPCKPDIFTQTYEDANDIRGYIECGERIGKNIPSNKENPFTKKT